MYQSAIASPSDDRGNRPARSAARTFAATVSTVRWGSILVAVLVTAALIIGWVTRNDDSINPEHGIGYALGITGGSMMLLLLVYPIRKRVAARAKWGSVGFWFRFHMILGLFGPVLILYHSRYSWGALNSAVALNAMLVVAGSGLIGRFFYARIHRGYSGRKLQVAAILTILRTELRDLSGDDAVSNLMRHRLEPFHQHAIRAGASFLRSAGAVVKIGLSTRFAQWGLRRDVTVLLRHSTLPTDQQSERRRELLRRSAAYFKAVRHAAEFAFYDRMLRLWHLLHIPLFVILVATTVLHIVAVHKY